MAESPFGGEVTGRLMLSEHGLRDLADVHRLAAVNAALRGCRCGRQLKVRVMGAVLLAEDPPVGELHVQVGHVRSCPLFPTEGGP